MSGDVVMFEADIVWFASETTEVLAELLVACVLVTLVNVGVKPSGRGSKRKDCCSLLEMYSRRVAVKLQSLKVTPNP